MTVTPLPARPPAGETPECEASSRHPLPVLGCAGFAAGRPAGR
ncbi:hypothetical protein ACIRPK_21420 [Kitasatospora sp. NPDC101801]